MAAIISRVPVVLSSATDVAETIHVLVAVCEYTVLTHGATYQLL